MKIYLLLFCFCSSCMTYTAPDGTKLTMVLSNAESVKTNDLTVEKLNQTEGVRVAGETAKEMLKIQGMFNLGETGIKSAESVVNNVAN